MQLRTPALVSALVVLVASGAWAEPPSHAPAHGYRAKQKAATAPPDHQRSGGLEVVFDSERGIHIAVGLPGIFFHDGRYYRQHEGRWHVSLTGRGEWRVSAYSAVPAVVVKAKGRSKGQPGPAKVRKAKRGP